MRSRYLDLVERTTWTAVQGFLAAWIVTANLDATTLKVAGVAGLIAAAKCLLAFQVGSGNTAATLPAGPDTDLGGDTGHADVGGLLYVLLAVVIVVVLLRVLGLL